MIVGAPLVGARNATNVCQCEYCHALPRIALHCPATTVMAIIVIVAGQWMAMPCIVPHCSAVRTLPSHG